MSFFQEIKKTSGQEYSSESFRLLRTYLNGYLKERGYPHCIVKSSLFARSMGAFKARWARLKEQELLLKNALSVNHA